MRNITNVLDTFGKSLLLDKLHRIKYLLGLILCAVSVSSTVVAAPADLDPTFGAIGKVISSPDGSQSIASYGMALQPDGKIVMVGSRINPSTSQGFIVARYNTDGSLDTTFGNNGWSSATFGASYEAAVSVDIQPDGKIVVGGTLRDVSFVEFGIVRFSSNGSLDTTFDGDGKVTIDFNDVVSGFHREYLGVLKVASDGKIVVAGHAADPAVDYRFILVRTNADGSLDTTFGTNGKFVDVTGGASSYDSIKDLVVLPDGKFVVVGINYSVIDNSGIAIKYNVNGVREWTYKRTSLPYYPIPYESLNGIAALPNGKFVVVGKRLGKIVATRLNANGTEDNSFNNTTVMPNGEAHSVAIQTDGKIVANISVNGSNSSFSLIRYNTNGSLDSGFGNGGIINTSVTNERDFGRKVLIQPDGKILVGGYSELSSPTRYYFSMVRYKGESVFPDNPLFDYDGDGKSDISVFRPSEGVWYLNQSTNGFVAARFGISTDRIVPADYDGDGKTDIAVYRDGTWWILQSGNNVVKTVQFGLAGDKPQTGDFDNDGKADLIVFRPSNNFWYRMSSTNGASSYSAFGDSGDKPVSGDFDGDGRSDLAVFRPSTGYWWYQSSINNAQLAVRWGLETDVPSPADFDGDGKTDFAVYRPSTGTWYIINSSNGSFTAVNFGVSEDKPVPADFDGDGRADVAVFRPSAGTWYLLQTTAGFRAAQWGAATDMPTENAFIH